MTESVRLEQLRALLARLERTPPSTARDWMLSEVRARAVDVETGATPTAMRARPEDEANLEILATPERSRRAVTEAVLPKRKRAPRRPRARIALHVPPPGPAAPVSPGPTYEPPVRESVVDLLEQGGVLCLDEQAAAPDGTHRPWAGGLRG
jgi:hypothetical protein